MILKYQTLILSVDLKDKHWLCRRKIETLFLTIIFRFLLFEAIHINSGKDKQSETWVNEYLNEVLNTRKECFLHQLFFVNMGVRSIIFHSSPPLLISMLINLNHVCHFNMRLQVMHVGEQLLTHRTHMLSGSHMDVDNMSLAVVLVVVNQLTQETLVLAILCHCHVFLSCNLKHKYTCLNELQVYCSRKLQTT